MENPLNKEQIDNIQRIQKLQGDEQKKEWEEFLKTLTKEQYDFLLKQNQKQDDGGCFFCNLMQDDTKKYKIYEDSKVLVILDINPVTVGHSLIIPKEHLKNSFDKEDTIYYFNIANIVSKSVKEKLGLDSNIYVTNGINAGQKGEHFLIHVIPRKENDGIVFNWNGQQAKEEDLNEVQDKLKIEIEEKKEEIKEIKKEEYRIP